MSESITHFAGMDVLIGEVVYCPFDFCIAGKGFRGFMFFAELLLDPPKYPCQPVEPSYGVNMCKPFCGP